MVKGIIFKNEKFKAAINRAGYERDVRCYERKLRVWNIFHMAMSAIAFTAVCSLFIFIGALDDAEHEKLVLSYLAVSGLVLATAALMLKVPRPKLPFGIKIYKGRYVIAGFTHPGQEVVEINTDFVYEDGRKCKVVPCNLQPRRRHVDDVIFDKIF